MTQLLCRLIAYQLNSSCSTVVHVWAASLSIIAHDDVGRNGKSSHHCIIHCRG